MPARRGVKQRRARDVDVCRARLLIRRPRRAVTLDETSNHREARVVGVARTVAEFLGVPVEESGRRRDRDGADGA